MINHDRRATCAELIRARSDKSRRDRVSVVLTIEAANPELLAEFFSKLSQETSVLDEPGIDRLDLDAGLPEPDI
jgi:hypothetical protein